MRIHEPVQGLGATREERQVALQRLGESVEQRPRVAGLELRVRRRPPLRHHLRQGGHRHNADIDGPDHQIVRGDVVQPGVAIPGDPGVLAVPPLHELPDGTLGEHGEVALDETRVFSGELNF